MPEAHPSTDGAPIIDLDALAGAAVASEPFDHVIVPGFVPADSRAALARDFPKVDRPGSIPVGELTYGPAFSQLIDALHGPTLTAAVGAKFGMDLTGRPTMITVRGHCRARDGKIHTDSRTKLITALLYMNEDWVSAEGRLRLLHGPDNIDDYAVEVPPEAWTLLLFRCSDNAWHGHTSFEGERRAIQLNWVRDRGVVLREQLRHTVSTRVKRLMGKAA